MEMDKETSALFLLRVGAGPPLAAVKLVGNRGPMFSLALLPKLGILCAVPTQRGTFSDQDKAL